MSEPIVEIPLRLLFDERVEIDDVRAYAVLERNGAGMTAAEIAAEMSRLVAWAESVRP